MRIVERQYECPNEHLWLARGENHWNPWGDPDWAALSRAEVTCPTCGRSGFPRRNVGCGLITPDGTLYV